MHLLNKYHVPYLLPVCSHFKRTRSGHPKAGAWLATYVPISGAFWAHMAKPYTQRNNHDPQTYNLFLYRRL